MQIRSRNLVDTEISGSCRFHHHAHKILNVSALRFARVGGTNRGLYRGGRGA